MGCSSLPANARVLFLSYSYWPRAPTSTARDSSLPIPDDAGRARQPIRTSTDSAFSPVVVVYRVCFTGSRILERIHIFVFISLFGRADIVNRLGWELVPVVNGVR